MTHANTTADTVIIDTIRVLLRRKNSADVEIRPDSELSEDLQLESLDVAELSAVLEDTLGRDPYTEGFVPRTVGELIAFYDIAP